MSRNAKIVLLVILLAVFLAEAVAAAVVVLHHSKNHSSGSTGSNSQTVSSNKDACSIFTLADAKQLLNGDAIGGSQAVTSSSSNVQVTGCSYKLEDSTAASGTPTETASLIVHRPLTTQGIAGNQRIFSGRLPPGAQPVSGYGNKAFWDTQLGQLNILKNNTWYVLTYGAATPAGRNLEQTRQLADILSAKL